MCIRRGGSAGGTLGCGGSTDGDGEGRASKIVSAFASASVCVAAVPSVVCEEPESATTGIDASLTIDCGRLPSFLSTMLFSASDAEGASELTAILVAGRSADVDLGGNGGGVGFTSIRGGLEDGDTDTTGLALSLPSWIGIEAEAEVLVALDSSSIPPACVDNSG